MYNDIQLEEQHERKELKKQIKFIKEIDKEKMITRQTLLTNGMQKEDDAQHAWHMA